VAAVVLVDLVLSQVSWEEHLVLLEVQRLLCRLAMVTLVE
jgi:hypothetical protein